MGVGLRKVCVLLRIYMHAPASYHDALSLLTKNQSKVSKQHKDLGKCRLQRDYNDFP